ncbi:MAG: PQQ-binding-like beta-propeller repeat protein [Pseudonocardiaceae bacterium]
MTSTTQPPPIPQPRLDRTVPKCPYVGLVPFDESDAPYFFGRQRECEVVVANLTASRLTLLYAASGVGKSSVLRAAALPLLQQIAGESYEDLGVPDAAAAYIREWSLAPLDTIATAVLDAVSQVPGAGPVEMPGPPRLSVPWLREVLQHSGIAAIYLVLDQFEEYFLYHPDEAGEDGLAGELGHILNTPDLPVNVLLSIREDALAALDRFKGRVPRLYDNYLRLAHLGRNAAREAIEGPLDHYNQVVPPDSAMTVEPELTVALLDQVRTGNLVMAPEGAASSVATDGREDIEAPYLQLVLTRLWEAERDSGSAVLRRSTLDELGGAQTIVQTHLRAVMDGLSPEQTEVAAAVFRYLVTTSGSKIALTAQDLADLSSEPVGSVRELMQSLSAGRQSILRPVPPPPGVPGPSRYEIFHDAMGPAVLDWRRQYIAQRAAQREQAEASRKLVAEREQARAEAQATRQRLRQTLLAAGLVVVLLIAGGLVVLFYRTSREADKQRLLSEAAATLSDNPVQSLRRAVDAYRISDDEDTREAVLTAASVPHSSVVAGSPGEPRVAGMVVTPDQRHVVTYDAQGGIRVIGDDGRVGKQAKAAHLAGTVVAVATNPNASQVAVATDQGSVAVIDAGTGRQVNLTTDGSPVSAVPSAVSWLDSSPDNLVLVVTSQGLAATYSATTGQRVTRFPGTVNEALPTADGQVVTSDRDSRLRVWNARTAEKVAESSPLPGQTRYLQRYGHEVVGVTGNRNNSNIVRWNWRSPEPWTHPFSFSDSISQVVVREDARTVTLAVDKQASTYSLDDGSLLFSLPHQPGNVSSVAICPRDRWIATAGADGRVRVWSAKLHIGTPTRATYEFIAHRDDVQSVSFLRDGKALISLGRDGTVRLWDIPQVYRFDLHNNSVRDLDLSADGQRLATASSDGNVRIVDPVSASNAPVVTVPLGAGARIENVRFDPTDPHRVVTLARSGTRPDGWRWADSGRPAERFPVFDPASDLSGWLVSLDISPDGNRVAAGDSSGKIHLWDAHTGRLISDHALKASGHAALGITFDPSGHLFAAIGPDGILLQKLDTTEKPRLLALRNATTVAFDPRGEHIVGGTEGGVLRVWTRDGQLVHELVAHGSTLGHHPSFSGDGSLVAVGTSEGLIEVWNVHSGRRVMLTRQHGDSVNDVLFLPGDRSQLVSASDDSTVALFGCDACKDPDAVVRTLTAG